jgi:hypothetical protein
MKRCADEYKFRAEGDDKTEIVRLPDAILRWDNRVVREDDAALFLWVRDKRPICAAQFFLQGDVWHHEFQSLTDERFDVVWRDGARWTWSPERAGVELKRADLDAPAAKAPLRLRQMRSFAERFSATTEPTGTSSRDRVKNLHQLRLLPTPIYRYANDGEPLDGALFAFAQGTNPEILLLMEAVREDGKDHWRYAFAPMTSFGVQVKQDEKVVWEKELIPIPATKPDPKSPYQFRFRLLPRGESK